MSEHNRVQVITPLRQDHQQLVVETTEWQKIDDEFIIDLRKVAPVSPVLQAAPSEFDVPIGKPVK